MIFTSEIESLKIYGDNKEQNTENVKKRKQELHIVSPEYSDSTVISQNTKGRADASCNDIKEGDFNQESQTFNIKSVNNKYQSSDTKVKLTASKRNSHLSLSQTDQNRIHERANDLDIDLDKIRFLNSVYLKYKAVPETTKESNSLTLKDYGAEINEHYCNKTSHADALLSQQQPVVLLKRLTLKDLNSYIYEKKVATIPDVMASPSYKMITSSSCIDKIKTNSSDNLSNNYKDMCNTTQVLSMLNNASDVIGSTSMNVPDQVSSMVNIDSAKIDVSNNTNVSSRKPETEGKDAQAEYNDSHSEKISLIDDEKDAEKCNKTVQSASIKDDSFHKFSNADKENVNYATGIDSTAENVSHMPLLVDNEHFQSNMLPEKNTAANVRSIEELEMPALVKEEPVMSFLNDSSKESPKKYLAQPVDSLTSTPIESLPTKTSRASNLEIIKESKELSMSLHSEALLEAQDFSEKTNDDIAQISADKTFEMYESISGVEKFESEYTAHLITSPSDLDFSGEQTRNKPGLFFIGETETVNEDFFTTQLQTNTDYNDESYYSDSDCPRLVIADEAINDELINQCENSTESNDTMNLLIENVISLKDETGCPLISETSSPLVDSRDPIKAHETQGDVKSSEVISKIDEHSCKGSNDEPGDHQHQHNNKNAGFSLDTSKDVKGIQNTEHDVEVSSAIMNKNKNLELQPEYEVVGSINSLQPNAGLKTKICLKRKHLDGLNVVQRENNSVSNQHKTTYKTDDETEYNKALTTKKKTEGNIVKSFHTRAKTVENCSMSHRNSVAKIGNIVSVDLGKALDSSFYVSQMNTAESQKKQVDTEQPKASTSTRGLSDTPGKVKFKSKKRKTSQSPSITAQESDTSSDKSSSPLILLKEKKDGDGLPMTLPPKRGRPSKAKTQENANAASKRLSLDLGSRYNWLENKINQTGELDTATKSESQTYNNKLGQKNTSKSPTSNKTEQAKLQETAKPQETNADTKLQENTRKPENDVEINIHQKLGDIIERRMLAAHHDQSPGRNKPNGSKTNDTVATKWSKPHTPIQRVQPQIKKCLPELVQDHKEAIATVQSQLQSTQGHVLEREDVYRATEALTNSPSQPSQTAASALPASSAVPTPNDHCESQKISKQAEISPPSTSGPHLLTKCQTSSMQSVTTISSTSDSIVLTPSSAEKCDVSYKSSKHDGGRQRTSPETPLPSENRPPVTSTDGKHQTSNPINVEQTPRRITIEEYEKMKRDFKRVEMIVAMKERERNQALLMKHRMALLLVKMEGNLRAMGLKSSSSPSTVPNDYFSNMKAGQSTDGQANVGPPPAHGQKPISLPKRILLEDRYRGDKSAAFLPAESKPPDCSKIITEKIPRPSSAHSDSNISVVQETSKNRCSHGSITKPESQGLTSTRDINQSGNPSKFNEPHNLSSVPSASQDKTHMQDKTQQQKAPIPIVDLTKSQDHDDEILNRINQRASESIHSPTVNSGPPQTISSKSQVQPETNRDHSYQPLGRQTTRGKSNSPAVNPHQITMHSHNPASKVQQRPYYPGHPLPVHEPPFRQEVLQRNFQVTNQSGSFTKSPQPLSNPHNSPVNGAFHREHLIRQQLCLPSPMRNDLIADQTLRFQRQQFIQQQQPQHNPQLHTRQQFPQPNQTPQCIPVPQLDLRGQYSSQSPTRQRFPNPDQVPPQMHNHHVPQQQSQSNQWKPDNMCYQGQFNDGSLPQYPHQQSNNQSVRFAPGRFPHPTMLGENRHIRHEGVFPDPGRMQQGRPLTPQTPGFIPRQSALPVRQETLPTPTMTGRICIVCNQRAAFLCSGCKRVWYCSQHCQIKGWQNHRTECTKQVMM